MAMALKKVIPDCHFTQITSVAFNSHKREYYTGDDGGVIKVWDQETGKFVRSMTQHKGGIQALQYTSIRLLMSGSLDSHIIVWNGKGDVMQSFDCKSPVYCMTWCSKGNHLFVGGVASIRILKATTGESRTKILTSIVHFTQESITKPITIRNNDRVKHVEMHKEFVKGIVICEGGRIYSAGFDKFVCCFDFEEPDKLRLVNSYHAHDVAVTAIDYDPDQNRVLTGSFDATIKVWTVDSFNLVQSYSIFQDTITGLAYIPAIRVIWAVACSDSCAVFDPRSGMNVTEYKMSNTEDKTGKIMKICSFSDSSELVTTTDKRELILWKYDPNGAISIINGHTDWVETLAWAERKPTQLVSAGADTTVRKWDATSELYPELYLEQEVMCQHKGSVLCSVLDETGDLLITGSDDTTIRVWSCDEDPEKQMEMHGRNKFVFYEHTDRVTGLVLAGHILISVSWDCSIRFYDINTGTLGHTITNAHDDFITSIDYSVDRDVFATSSADQLVYLWEMETKGVCGVLRGHTREVTCVRYHPVCQRWVTSSDDGSIRLWNENFAVAALILVGDDAVTAMCCDRTKPWVIAGLANFSIVVYSLENEDLPPLQRHVGHSDIVRAVIHIPYRNQYVSASWDHTVRVWTAHSDFVTESASVVDDVVESVASDEENDDEDEDEEDVSESKKKPKGRKKGDESVPYHELNPPFVPKTLKYPPVTLPFDSSNVSKPAAVKKTAADSEEVKKGMSVLNQKLDALEQTLTKMYTEQKSGPTFASKGAGGALGATLKTKTMLKGHAKQAVSTTRQGASGRDMASARPQPKQA